MSSVASSSGYRVTLQSREAVADGTFAFDFEKPIGFTFKPGQFIEMTLIDPPQTDSEGNGRAFSIASSPQHKNLRITTRMRDTAFKRVLSGLGMGAEVEIEGPFGDLVLHNNPARPAVLLAGGIGITPFRSIVLSAAERKLSHRIFLFYSNRRPEDAAYLKELQDLQLQNPNYKLIATMTQIEDSRQPWHGETGPIDKQMLARGLGGAQNAICYLAGPPGMIAGMRTMLNGAGIDDDDIRAEEFSGY